MLIDDINVKVSEFSCAIKKYNDCSVYARLETLVAVVIVFLQAVSLIYLLSTNHCQMNNTV